MTYMDPAHQAGRVLFLPAQHQNVTLLAVFVHGACNPPLFGVRCTVSGIKIILQMVRVKSGC